MKPRAISIVIAADALAIVCVVLWFATYSHFKLMPTNDSPLLDFQDALYDRRWAIMEGLGIAASLGASLGAIMAVRVAVRSPRNVRGAAIGLGMLGVLLVLAGLALAALAWMLAIPWG